MSSPNGGIRLTLDVAIGETSALDGADKDKIQDLATRVKDLNARLNDIRREQVFQRVSCPLSPIFSSPPPVPSSGQDTIQAANCCEIVSCSLFSFHVPP